MIWLNAVSSPCPCGDVPVTTSTLPVASIRTLAASPAEAARALPPGARQLLLEWRFHGHLEVRPGGLVVHFAHLRPAVAHLDRLFSCVPDLALRLLTG